MIFCVLMSGNISFSVTVSVTGCVYAVLFWVKLQMFLSSKHFLKLCGLTLHSGGTDFA